MRKRLTAMALLISLPALAQTPPQHPTGIKPVDKGPYTPQADAAYQGGGVILQSRPGQPAPRPQPTPSGQAPQNAVPR